METRYLESFLKIADTRSISRAAESLGLSQPSLSQQLLRLEDDVGAKLFFRTARGVNLTEAGRVFQEHARRLLRAAEIAIEDIRQLDAEPAGEVILAVPYSISEIAGVALIEAFLQHAPQVSFRLVEAMTGQIRGWLDSAKVDLGILNELGALRNLSARSLATEELYLVAPPGVYGSIENHPEISPQELQGLPLILPGMPHGSRQIIEQAAVTLGLELDVRQDVDAPRHIAALVSKGLLYSVLPLASVSAAASAGQVSIAKIHGAPIKRTLLLARNSASVITHASVRAEALTLKVLNQLIQNGVWRAEPSAALR